MYMFSFWSKQVYTYAGCKFISFYSLLFLFRFSRNMHTIRYHSYGWIVWIIYAPEIHVHVLIYMYIHTITCTHICTAENIHLHTRQCIHMLHIFTNKHTHIYFHINNYYSWWTTVWNTLYMYLNRNISLKIGWLWKEPLVVLVKRRWFTCWLVCFSLAKVQPGCWEAHHPGQWLHQRAVCSIPRRCG